MTASTIEAGDDDGRLELMGPQYNGVRCNDCRAAEQWRDGGRLWLRGGDPSRHEDRGCWSSGCSGGGCRISGNLADRTLRASTP